MRIVTLLLFLTCMLHTEEIIITDDFKVNDLKEEGYKKQIFRILEPDFFEFNEKIFLLVSDGESETPEKIFETLQNYKKQGHHIFILYVTTKKYNAAYKQLVLPFDLVKSIKEGTSEIGVIKKNNQEIRDFVKESIDRHISNSVVKKDAVKTINSVVLYDNFTELELYAKALFIMSHLKSLKKVNYYLYRPATKKWIVFNSIEDLAKEDTNQAKNPINIKNMEEQIVVIYSEELNEFSVPDKFQLKFKSRFIQIGNESIEINNKEKIENALKNLIKGE